MKNPKKPEKAHYVNLAQGMTSDPSLINFIISNSLNWSLIKSNRVIEGIGNEVYIVTNLLNEDEKVIVRINHKNAAGFYREQWAMAKVKEYGVPVPKIIAVNIIKNNKEEPITYCVEEFLNGDNLSDLLDKGLNEEKMKNYGIKAGQVLANIHKVKTKGWGKFIENGVALHNQLLQSIGQHADKQSLISAANTVKLPIYIIEEAIFIIDRIKTTEPPHLIHTDYAPKHIFFKGGNVDGVIDFEICMSGTATMDINRWRSQDNRINLKYLIQGYESVTKLRSNFWDEMFIIQVHSALRSMLFHHNSTHDINEIKKAADEVERLVTNKKPLME